MLVLSKSIDQEGMAHLEAEIGDCLLSIDELKQLQSDEFQVEIANMVRALDSQVQVRKPTDPGV
jgi:hypothetical protein